MWNGKSCRLLCLPFWSRPLRNAPIRQAIVGECRSTTPSIGPRMMIHGKMLSWQLASLMMAHSLNMAITLGGSILCCGELVASSPKKLSNQIPVPPLLLCLSSYRRNSSPIPSAPKFLLARIRPRVWEKHGCRFCPTSEVAG